jgi:hypothetical protein
MNAERQHGSFAVHFSVTVSHAPVGNVPGMRWYLDLRAGQDPMACGNSSLPGGVRLAANEYVWKNLGSTFVWYLPPENACRGTVSVIAENDHQHCISSLELAHADTPPRGGPAECALGGYLFGPATVPVPPQLLREYAQVERKLGQLVDRLKAGRLAPAELDHAVARLLHDQDSTFRRLFPPVWGCDFNSVFRPLVLADTALAGELESLRAGKPARAAAVRAGAGHVRAAARSLAACERTSTRWWGAPPTTVQALRDLSSELESASPAPSAKTAHTLGRLRALLAKSFPTVYGVPYGDLVDQIVAEHAAIEAATSAAAAGNAGGAIAGLSRAQRPATKIGNSIRKENIRITTRERNG